jgi:hypothetical protein
MVGGSWRWSELVGDDPSLPLKCEKIEQRRSNGLWSPSACRWATARLLVERFHLVNRFVEKKKILATRLLDTFYNPHESGVGAVWFEMVRPCRLNARRFN